MKRQAGFTLVEMLVALSISAVIAVMAYQSISEVTAVKTHTEKHSDAFSALQRAVWWMEQDFAQLAPRSVQDELGSRIPAYRNEINRVELTRLAAFPSPYGESGLVRVGYMLENETLFRLVWPVLDRAPDTQVQKWAVLEGVKGFSVRQMDAQKQWHDQWPIEVEGQDSLRMLPDLVEITLNLEGFGELKRFLVGVDG